MPDEPRNEREQRGLVPVPDPTVLTTEALRREVASLREYFDVSLSGIVNTFTARLNAMDEAQRLFQSGLSRVPSDTDKQVSQLASLLGERFESFNQRIVELSELQREKFKSVAQQFAERDTRTDKLAVATETAVSAALKAQQSQQEKQAESFTIATAKTESSFEKRIEQQAAQAAITKEAIAGQIGDLQKRQDRMEGAALGQLANKTETHQAGSGNIALIAVVVSVIAVLVSIVLFAMRTR